MSERRRKFDQDFKDGAVRIVLESGRPVAEIARELDVHEGTLGNWVNKARAAQQPGVLSESERDELTRFGMGRRTRSSPGPGKPVTWRRGPACSQHQREARRSLVNIGAPWPRLDEAEPRVLAMQTKLHQWAGR